jgi:hypothetical protein
MSQNLFYIAFFCIFFQQKNAMSRKVSELEGDVKRLDLELKQSYSTQRPKTAGFGGLIPPNRAEMVAGMYKRN